MNTSRDAIADTLARSVDMFKTHLAPFTDAEMLARPCPHANHAAWQLGQVTSADHHMIESVAPGVMPALPPGFDQQFTKETASINDPAKFPTKQQLLEHFQKGRLAAAAWVRTLSEEQLSKPTPDKLQKFAKNVGELAVMMSMHSMMHLGQIQVIRRKLNKPVMF